MKKLFFTSLLTILSGFSISTQVAQAYSEIDEINQDILRATYGMCQMNGMENCERYNPEYQQFLKDLANYCFEGNQDACNDYNQILEEEKNNTSNY